MTGTNLSIHNILCPTDFSESATDAFTESVRLARWFGAKITAVHVLPPAMPIAPDATYIPIPVEVIEKARDRALEQLRQFVAVARLGGVPVDVVVREGSVCDQIRALAQDTGAQLVVMGTHGRSGFKRLALGSATEAVLDHPPAPVLTVNRHRSRPEGPFHTVLCAADLSQSSNGTIASALAIAGEGAKRLVVLNVIEHGMETPDGALERAALAAVHELVDKDARKSFRIRERVTTGAPGREILRVAEEEGADLIVLGSHGGGLLAQLFGSTARDVVRDASCPVIVVPAGYVWPATSLIRRDEAGRVGSTLTA
jgi:nucleotide-binding universal stress UspA family protein